MGALTAIGPISIDMYLPAFPEIARGLSSSSNEVERTLAAYLIGMASAQLVYGPLADRFGRKPPLYGALVLYIVASAACALALLSALNRVDFPTFGNPTIPACKAINQ